MSSQAKIKASRANGRKGGARTLAGKSNASRNALRHGFAAISRKQPEIVAEIAPITSALCGASTDPLLFEQALIVAENAFVLCCVQVEYIAAIERHRDSAVTPLATGDLGFAHAKATFARAKLTHEMLVKRNAQAPAAETAAATDEPNTGSPQLRERVTTEHVSGVQQIPERDEFDAMRSAMPDLDRLERYRRRAWSRQRRAIRRFMEIQSASGVPR